jgi:hypothetical protein
MDGIDDDPENIAASSLAVVSRSHDLPAADQIEAVLKASNEDGCDVGDDGDEAGNMLDSQGDDGSEVDDDDEDGDDDDDDDIDDDDDDDDDDVEDGEPCDDDEAGDLESDEEGKLFCLSFWAK